MRDKLGQDIRPGDFVLTAHVGPYLNFGKVHAVEICPREYLDIHEAYQEANNPEAPFVCRRRSIASPHRVIRLDNVDDVPEDVYQVIIHGPPQTTKPTKDYSPEHVRL